MDCSRAKTRDPDEWLENAPPFSRQMAMQLREWFLHWEPDLTESIKWNVLCFSGRKLVCGISACKMHLAVPFFRGTELDDPAGLFSGGEANTNIRAIRLTSLETLNRDALRVLLQSAVALDSQQEIPAAPKQKREPWPVPEFFAKALAMKKHRAAAAGFAKLSPSCQREWLVWVSTAKRDETRARRLAETLAALALGRKWIDRKMRSRR
jgi:hypothetical protein